MFRLFDSCRKKPKAAVRPPKVRVENNYEDMRISLSDQSIHSSFEIVTHQPVEYSFAKQQKLLGEMKNETSKELVAQLPENHFLLMTFIHDNLNSTLPANRFSLKREAKGLRMMYSGVKSTGEFGAYCVYIEGNQHIKELVDLYMKYKDMNTLGAIILPLPQEFFKNFAVSLLENLTNMLDQLINASDHSKAAENALNNIKFLLGDASQKHLDAIKNPPTQECRPRI